MSIISVVRSCAVFIAAAVFAATNTPAQAAEISAELIAKAKQEGQVVYYTDLIVDQIVRPLAGAFEAKYGIKVGYARADSQVNILKMLNEQKAGRVMSDIFGLNTGLGVLIAAGAARQFTTANGEELPARYRDPDRYWVSSHLFVITPALNTDLVPAAQRPRSYEDLLAPYWRDKMVWKPNDLTGAPGFIGNVLIGMGEERGKLPAQACQAERQDGQRQRPRSARPGDRRGIFTEPADPQSPCRHQRPPGRAGGLGAAQSGHGRARPGGHDQRRTAPQCRSAVRRVHDLQGGPADFPEGRLSAGAPRRPAAHSRPYPGDRRLHRQRDNPGGLGQGLRALERGVQGFVSMSRRAGEAGALFDWSVAPGEACSLAPPAGRGSG
jgi:hypothetical protein